MRLNPKVSHDHDYSTTSMLNDSETAFSLRSRLCTTHRGERGGGYVFTALRIATHRAVPANGPLVRHSDSPQGVEAASRLRSRVSELT
jgi:hypothetical protein